MMFGAFILGLATGTALAATTEATIKAIREG